jgi:photosystem II stability/assembly factor-like uncharacterized protein
MGTMLEHLDDPEEIHPGAREMTRVLHRADAIRFRRRWVMAVGACCVLLAASIGFFAARPSTHLSTSSTSYEFNLVKGPLPVGSPVPTTALTDVQFANAQYGFALALHRGSVLLAASSDGGATWEVRNDHLPPGLVSDTGYPGQFEFVGFTGYLWGAQTASGAPLWVSHDDGTTWDEADIGPDVFDVSAIGLDVWALTGSCESPAATGATPCSVGLEMSFDGGGTWVRAGSTFESAAVVLADSAPQPVELARITRSNAYVLTTTRNAQSFATWQLAFTDDAGTTWTAHILPCSGAFSAGAELAASSTTDLWLLCGSGAAAGAQSKELFRSIDGGMTWSLVASATGLGTPPPSTVPPNPLPLAGYVSPYTLGHRNLAVLSSTTAWLFPSRAALYKTTDGGASWMAIPETVAAGFDGGGVGNVTFLNATHGWVCEYGLGLWHTDDGVHWEPLGSM